MYYYILVTEICAKISFQMLDLVRILLFLPVFVLYMNTCMQIHAGNVVQSLLVSWLN